MVKFMKRILDVVMVVMVDVFVFGVLPVVRMLVLGDVPIPIGAMTTVGRLVGLNGDLHYRAHD
jgi:hypothetical protein